MENAVVLAGCYNETRKLARRRSQPRETEKDDTKVEHSVQGGHFRDTLETECPL
jgi:hypothetical protein